MGMVQQGVSLIPSVTMGGVTLPLSKALIMFASGASARWDTLRLNGAAYVVPANKKLIIIAARMASDSATGVGILFGHGTAAVTNSASAPAGDVLIGLNGGATTPVYAPGGVGATSEVPVYVEIPAGKYPYLKISNSTGQALVLAYLVDA